MICLSLRVSGEKTFDRSNKMLDQRVEEIRTVVADLGDDFKEQKQYLNDLTNADTLKEQISVVTSIFENHVNSKDNKLLHLLLKVHLKLPSSNPLKKYILSSFAELDSDLVDLLAIVIIDCLCSDNASSFEPDEFISLLHCINSCFDEKFVLFETIMAKCSNVIFITVTNIISTCSNCLRDASLTPVFKEKMLKTIHSLSQCVITLLHKVTAESLPAVFLSSFMQYLSNDDLPLNTKTNIAIIIGMINQLTSSYSWDQLVESCLSYTPITVVSMCSGIFSSAPKSLWKTISSGEYLANYILDQLLKLEEKNSSDCKVVLGVSRGVCQYTKIRIACDIPQLDNDPVLGKIYSYLWMHLEHPMDAVRHLASESLSNIIILGEKNSRSNIIGYILSEVTHIPLYRRSKYVILSSLVGHVPVDELMSHVPNLVNILLLSVKESSGAKHVVLSLEKLLCQHYSEIRDKNKWLEIWVDPVVSCLNDNSIPILEQILSQIIKLNPSVIDYIFRLDEKIFYNKIKIILLCLKVSQKNGILKGSSSDKWKGFIEYTFLESCLHHKERDARLSLFGLIVDSSKSTESFAYQELDLVRSFLKHNVSCQSASFRQSFLALFKKFLVRMKDSHDHEKNAWPNKRKVVENLEEAKDCFYCEFLDWTVEFCCGQLFPGASFSRRSTVLNMLDMIFSLSLCNTSVFTMKMAHRLLYILQVDTYEENKKLAKEIIQHLDYSLLNIQNEKAVCEAFNDCLLFASSIRPPDCISAAYSLSSLLKFKQVKDVFCDMANCTSGLTSDIKDLGMYYCLFMIVDDLKCKAEVASSNIHKAAKEGPMYGLLYTVRHILQDIDLHEVSSDKHWVDLLKSLIKIGMECTQAVSCIVNNSSPEGHLPMDLSLDFSNLTLLDGSHQTTSQLLLLCSWRTVKEVCLLFGEIVERVDIYPEDDGIHFSIKDVLTIGGHLTTMLSEIKHRGAFEQAYIGFCKLAATLWKYPKGNLHELPSIWLKETLEEIVSRKSKLCATRRSAGIPFIIQALVVTEREILGGKQLNMTVNRVLELGSSGDSWETRVHAMNILRSLYRSSHLGEAVSPFVAQGFIISFNGFSGQTWPERNSATLLFSSLITRVFGVNRSRSHNLSWKNKMTGRIFFQRYPELYSVILDKLEKSSETDIHSVFPVLLLLSRLYPSSLEGSDSNLRLEDLIPLVSKCGMSHIMKIRSLAASALVGLIYPFNVCHHISKTLSEIDDNTSENSVHGFLLQILRLLKSGPEIPSETSNLTDLIHTWFTCTANFISTDKHSMVVKCTCLNIILHLLFKYFDIVPEEEFSIIIRLIKKDVFVENELTVRNSIGLSQYLELSTILLIWNGVKNKDVKSTLIELLNVKNYEIFQLVLEFASNVLTFNESSNEELDLFIKSLKADSLEELRSTFISSDTVHNFLIEKLCNEKLHHEDSIKVISVVKELPLVVQKISLSHTNFIELLKRLFSIESHKSCVIDIYSLYLNQKERLNEAESEFLYEVLSTCIKSEFECRLSAAQLLVSHYKSIVNQTSSHIVFSVVNCMVHLVCDDCEEVRIKMSQLLDEQIDSDLALKRCFELMVSTVENKYLLCCALTAWSVGPFCEDLYSLEQTEKAFDKGDMNSFKEDVILTILASRYLKDILLKNPDYLEQVIPYDVHTWLDDYTGLSNSCTTLHDVIRSLDQYSEIAFENCGGRYHYFINFSSSYRNYSLFGEKNDLMVYK